MKESMPSTHGWVDRGPAIKNTFDRCPRIPECPEVGPLIKRDALARRIRKSYTEAQRDAIIKQGKELPRWLTLEQSRRADANRRQFNEDAKAYELQLKGLTSNEAPYMIGKGLKPAPPAAPGRPGRFHGRDW